MAITLVCPSCKKALKSNNPIPPGKSVKCPGCQNTFVVPAEDGSSALPAKAPAATPAKAENTVPNLEIGNAPMGGMFDMVGTPGPAKAPDETVLHQQTSLEQAAAPADEAVPEEADLPSEEDEENDEDAGSKSRRKPRRAGDDEEDDDDRPRSKKKSRRDDDDEVDEDDDDRPRRKKKSSRADDDDEVDEDDDDRPRRKKKSSRDEDDEVDEDDDRPRRKKKSRRDDDDEVAEDDDDRPRRKKKSSRADDDDDDGDRARRNGKPSRDKADDVDEVDEVEEAEEVEEVAEDQAGDKVDKDEKADDDDVNLRLKKKSRLDDGEVPDLRIRDKKARRPLDDQVDDDDAPRRKKKSRRDDDDDENDEVAEDDDDRPRRKKKSRRDEDDDDEDEDEDDDRPRSGKRGKKKKKKRQKAGSNLMLILGAAGGGVVLLVFVITAFVWPGFLLGGGGGASDDALLYFPAKCNIVVGVNLSAPGSSFYQKLISKMGRDEDMDKEFLELIDRVTHGSDVSSGGVAFIQTKKPVEPEKLQKWIKMDNSEQFKGKTVLRKKDAHDEVAVILSPTAFIICKSSDAELEKMLEQKQPQLRADVLAEVRRVRGNAVWVVVAMDSFAGKMGMRDGPAKMVEGAKVASVHGNPAADGKSIRLEASIACPSADVASKTAAAMKEQMKMLTEGPFAPPGFADAAKSLQISSSGVNLIANVTLTDTVVEQMLNFMPGMGPGPMLGPGPGPFPNPKIGPNPKKTK